MPGLFESIKCVLSFGLLPFFIPARKRNFLRIYSFLAIHILTASSTALDKSPFFPPSLSTVFNLSCFSSSPGSSTHIRPNFNQLLSVFMHDSHVSEFFPISEFPDAKFHVCFCCHFSFTTFSLIYIIYYTLTHL